MIECLLPGHGLERLTRCQSRARHARVSSPAIRYQSGKPDLSPWGFDIRIRRHLDPAGVIMASIDVDQTRAKVPRSATRQNLLYSIESLERRVAQVENAHNLRSGNSAKFFSDARRELDRCRVMAVNDYLLRQIYIYQKLFDISRDLYAYSPPSDARYQFYFIQRTLAPDIGDMSEIDKKAFAELTKVFASPASSSEQESIPAPLVSALTYFSKVIQDRQILTIWNSEKLGVATVRLGTLLCFSVLALICTAAAMFNCDKCTNLFGLPINAVRLVSSVLGGTVGGCISAIAVSRSSDKNNDTEQVPLISTDWMRPILGAVAGLVFGLTVIAGAEDMQPTFLLAGAIAFGFSEQVLYSWLRKRADQLEVELGSQIGQKPASKRKDR